MARPWGDWWEEGGSWDWADRAWVRKVEACDDWRTERDPEWFLDRERVDSLPSRPSRHRISAVADAVVGNGPSHRDLACWRYATATWPARLNHGRIRRRAYDATRWSRSCCDASRMKPRLRYYSGVRERYWRKKHRSWASHDDGRFPDVRYVGDVWANSRRKTRPVDHGEGRVGAVASDGSWK